ncbi:MAG: alpha/beta hydrolase, partial [Alphaproteobacteria bacterium]
MLIQLGNRNIYYDLVGAEDAPVVCMTHCLSSDGGVWAEQVPVLLANNWRVLRLDMRGHGGSDAGSEQPMMADYADDIAKVLDLLGIKKVHYVGLSIGGMIGQTFALDHGDRLHSLMLCSTSPQAVPGGEQMWFDRFDQVNAAKSVEPVANASMERWVTPGLQGAKPYSLYANPRDHQPDVHPRLHRRCEVCDEIRRQTETADDQGANDRPLRGRRSRYAARRQQTDRIADPRLTLFRNRKGPPPRQCRVS